MASQRDDLGYLLERAKQEKLLADRSADRNARAAHREMSSAYRARAKLLAPQQETLKLALAK